jgi:hypothetical protein
MQKASPVYRTSPSAVVAESGTPSLSHLRMARSRNSAWAAAAGQGQEEWRSSSKQQ